VESRQTNTLGEVLVAVSLDLDGLDPRLLEQGQVATADRVGSTEGQADVLGLDPLLVEPALEELGNEGALLSVRLEMLDPGRLAGAERAVAPEVVQALVEVVEVEALQAGDGPAADLVRGSVVHPEAAGAAADVDPAARQARAVAVDPLVGVADQEQVVGSQLSREARRRPPSGPAAGAPRARVASLG